MNPRDHAITFEAKKHSYRQTQDGVVVGLVMHPNDVDAALSIAALGTRYQVVLVQIGDDGEPVGGPAQTSDRRSWETLSNAQQAGIRCNDERFQQWVARQSKSTAATFVRDYCGVHSRADLNEGPPADRWRELDARYRAEAM